MPVTNHPATVLAVNEPTSIAAIPATVNGICARLAKTGFAGVRRVRKAAEMRFFERERRELALFGARWAWKVTVTN
jgi:hypothetical protein